MNFRQASHLFTVIVSWRDSLIYFARTKSVFAMTAFRDEKWAFARDENRSKQPPPLSRNRKRWINDSRRTRVVDLFLRQLETARQFTIGLIKTSIKSTMLLVKGEKGGGKGEAGRPFVFPCQHVTPARIYNRGCTFKTIAINPAPIWYIGISETILAIRINGRNGGVVHLRAILRLHKSLLPKRRYSVLRTVCTGIILPMIDRLSVSLIFENAVPKEAGDRWFMRLFSI